MNILVQALAFIFIVSASVGLSEQPEARSSDTDTAPQQDRVLNTIQLLGARWGRPAEPVAVQQYLPAARPVQPWPYRTLSSAAESFVTVTDSHAITAFVAHAPLKGVTAEMMAWWLSNIEGEATYVGDGKLWSKYLQW